MIEHGPVLNGQGYAIVSLTRAKLWREENCYYPEVAVPFLGLQKTREALSTIAKNNVER